MKVDQVIDEVSPEPGSGEEQVKRIRVRVSKLTDIREIRQSKQYLEEAITVLIHNFERRTGCPVMSVDQHQHATISMSPGWGVKVKL